MPRAERRRLLIQLGAVSLVLAACASPHKAAVHPARILGQVTKTPAVVGQPAPSGTGDLGAVSCADARHCWAVGVSPPSAVTAPPASDSAATVIAATANGGATWTAQHLSLATSPDLTGISCPLVHVCMAVGSTGANPPAGTVLTTSDGGHTWQEVAAPQGALAVTSVLCTTSADCTALVSDGTILWSADTTDFGDSWQREGDLPDGLQRYAWLSRAMRVRLAW